MGINIIVYVEKLNVKKSSQIFSYDDLIFIKSCHHEILSHKAKALICTEAKKVDIFSIACGYTPPTF